MKHFLSLLFLFVSCNSFSQELDSFQNDTIYAKKHISERIMFSVYNGVLQKEMATYYNSKGQLTKRYWFWNGNSKFHNVEKFYYSKDNKLTVIIDSFADGKIQKRNLTYKVDILLNSLTSENQNDTCYFMKYLGKDTIIKKWYRNKKCYRIDTTIFEKQDVKRRYFGTETDYLNEKSRWNYFFLNQFDNSGNLISVRTNYKNPFKYFTQYIYDKDNLLIKKQEIMLDNGNRSIVSEYIFKYK